MAKTVETIKRMNPVESQPGKRAKSITKQGKTKTLKPSVLEMVIYVLVIFLLVVGTYWRNKIWKSDVELWTDCVKKMNPELANALYQKIK